MTITVEPFAGGKPEFFHDLIEAKNRAQELANVHNTEYALFGDDHDLEEVVFPEKKNMIYLSLLQEVCDECTLAGGQLNTPLMDRIVEIVKEAR